MKVRRILTIIVALIIVPLLAFSLASAQGPDQQTPEGPESDLFLTANVRSSFSYQGVLEEGDSRVDGHRDMVFNIYGNQNCTGSAIKTITKDDLLVTNGLFSTDLGIDHIVTTGQGRWLRVTVEGTDLGCGEILPVPFAMSLVPGARMLAENSGALFGAMNASSSGANSHGLGGATSSPEAYGGVFTNSAGGTAIKAVGSIESTADSYVFVPGAQAVLHGATSGATLKYWGDGNVTLVADTVGEKELVFPVTMPAVLYGQSVRVEEVAFSFQHTEFVELSRVWVYRRALDGSISKILDDSTGWSSVKPHWKTLTFLIDDDNILSAEDGQLAVRITVDLEAANNIQFTGIRVRIGHDE